MIPAAGVYTITTELGLDPLSGEFRTQWTEVVSESGQLVDLQVRPGA